MTPVQLGARVRSISYVAAADAAQREEWVQRVLTLVEGMGEAFTLPALAAAFLSAAAIKPGRFNVGGVLVAIFFLAILNSGLNLLGAAAYVNDIVNGAALIVGVGVAGFFGRSRTA